MKIETKYAIGQEVWFLYYGKIFRDVVEHRMIIAVGNQKSDIVIYRTGKFNNLAEYELFPTKEELLKSLWNINQEEFKRQIEYPIDKLATADIRSKKEYEQVFWRRIELSSTIARTVRLCLQYPDLAKVYYDSLPKATID